MVGIRPPAQGVAGSGVGTTLLIKNDTQYNLSLYLSGPSDKTITVAPGGSQQLVLQAGQYRMAARVASPNVLPFYGEQFFGVGNYSENFYITTQ